MEGRSTIAWGPVSFWMVKLSGADRLKAHKSSDVCSEQMPLARLLPVCWIALLLLRCVKIAMDSDHQSNDWRCRAEMKA